jgi:DNA-binding MarR family transcriptional regulator
MNPENMNEQNTNEQNAAPNNEQRRPPEEPQEAMDLTEQFTRIAWLLNRYRLHNYMAHGPMGDPHRGQGRVLSLLKLKPEISQKELSYLLDMRPQSLGELLAKLERSGYITRTQSESDRRVVEIKLTEMGAKVAGDAEQQGIFASLFDSLSKEEQANLSDYLGRLIARMEEELGDEPQRGDFDWRERRRGRPPFGRDEEWRRGGPHHGPFGHHGRERGRMPFADFDPRGRLRDFYHSHRAGHWGAWQQEESAE